MKRISRRAFVRTTGTGAVCFWVNMVLGRDDNPVDKRPNILFIMSDDHAAHAISAYGSRINKTPNIDRIAEEGMRFDNCFCTNSICAPSRAVIITGKYSHINGVIDNGKAFDGSQQTLPKLLKQAGYQTAIVGKWHLQSEPTGFDYTNILPGQGEYYNPMMIENGTRKKCSGYVTDLITDSALGWLKAREPDKPFFLMLHHKAPHANWEPDEKHANMYSETDIPLPSTFNDDYRTRSEQIKKSDLHVDTFLWNLHFKRMGKLPDGVNDGGRKKYIYQTYMKNYLRCIASVDDNVGRVLDYLDDTGLSENTIVVYTSDNGFFLGDHGLYDKRFMYEHSLRIPFLMRYPKEILRKSTTEVMALNLDFAPTFLDFAGVPVPEDMQGVSLRNILKGKMTADWRTAIYYRFYEQAYGIGPHEGVRTLRYKLIHFLYGDKSWELYDLKEDTCEMTNIYGDSRNAQLVAELKSILVGLKARYGVKEPEI